MIVQPFIPFLLFVLALYATPGPATLSCAAGGAIYGFRKTLPYMFGIVTGLMIIFVASALGLGIFFTEYPLVHTIFKWISLAYILYLAYKIAQGGTYKNENKSRLGYLQGIPLALLNPKAYFAVMGTIAQFSIPGPEYGQSLILLFIWVFVLAVLIDLAWVYVGSVLGSQIQSGRMSSRVSITSAIILVASVVWAMFF